MNENREPDIALFRFTPTGQDGIHSGRPRVKVECLTCNEVVHRGTTGPDAWSKAHFNWKHTT